MDPKSKTPPEPSSRWIWPFELKERLGEGGMGVVYRGRYVVNDVEVAVKMLPDDVTNPVVLQRFERELDVLKTLKHPNIVRSFGGVCEDKRRFYAMELMHGGSLEDQLQERGRLSWEKVVEYAKQMCAALDYLHKHGVIHRDLKPANFLIDEHGQLKLSDFGLASVIAARRITSAGKTAGTLLYMAPEQIRGGDITSQTDLYALGCVLYELLTGKPPYLGNSLAATMHMHCKSAIPRVTQAALDCPMAFELLVTKLMAKDAADRPEDALAVARELSLVTPTVSVVKKQRAIDSDVILQSKKSSLSAVESLYKETRDLDDAAAEPMIASRPTVASDRTIVLALVACLMVISGLLGWVFSLRQSAEVAIRSEELWVEAAQSDQPAVRIHALQSLGRLPHVSSEGVAVIAEILGNKTESPDVRIAAATALGEMGSRARAASVVLHRTIQDEPNDNVRLKAQAALQKIQVDKRSSGTGWIIFFGLLSVLVAAGIILWRKFGHALVHESRTPYDTLTSR